MTVIDDALTEPEQRLWRAAGTATLVDLRTGEPGEDDPAQGASWDRTRTVRAELLVELLTGERQPDGAGRARAVKLRGARITGTLDLEATTLVCPLLLYDCFFDQPVSLRAANAPVVRLTGCHLPRLDAAQLETRGNLELKQIKATQVGLTGAPHRWLPRPAWRDAEQPRRACLGRL